MTDYGHELEFGVFLTPSADNLPDVLELAQLAEVLGLDVLSLQDHPYQAAFADTWTLLSVIGARTSTIRLAPNVASLPLRPPVVLAKSAATLDVATGGRVELGLGAGAFWDAIVAAGGPRRTPKQAVDALIEAIALIRQFWDGGSLRFAGEYYNAKGLHAGPKPAHEIPIWLGAYGPRMLRSTGELADAWVPSMGYADPPALPDMNARIDDAAVAVGRAPQSIRRVYNIFGRFGTGKGFLEGRPKDWAEQLSELSLSDGFATYILGADDPATLRRFSDEVMPAVREQVASERERPGGETRPAEVRSSPAAGAPLAVEPTRDTGERLTGTLAWDEANRPTHDEPSDATYTPQQQAVSQHLVDVHDGLRSELDQVRDIIDQVRDGIVSAGAARSAVNSLTMRQNNWTLGAFCASYCRAVATHHTLEDRGIFPHLRRAETSLSAVLDRLEDEHDVIADVLDRVDRALVGLVNDEVDGSASPNSLDEVQREVDLLTDTLLSHLAYEERELLGPLARHGFN